MPLSQVYSWPVKATVSQAFGSNPSNGTNPSGGHTGIDFACAEGTEIRSIGNGTVVYEGWAYNIPGGVNNTWWIAPNYAGIVVIIDHGEVVSIYGHNLESVVNTGDRVSRGQIISKSDTTGLASGPHLHFEVMPDGWDFNNGTYGRVNPNNYCTVEWDAIVPQGGTTNPLAPNERLCGPLGANQRAEANTSAAIVRTIPGNAREVFEGYVIGENKDGINVWYKDTHGYVWSGAFESQSTDGLPNLTPDANVPVAPNQRVTGPNGVVRRGGPDKNTNEIDRFDPDRILTLGGFVHGSDPYGDGNDIWFVGGLSGGYMWSGGFSDLSTTGLKDLTVNVPPNNPSTQPPRYSFSADFAQVNGITVEVSPAANTNVEVGNFPTDCKDVVDHWWNDPAKKPSIEGTLGEFTRENSFKSPHWIVGEYRIIQTVKMTDRAYHAGPKGNDKWGIEVDPRATEKDVSGNYTETARRIQANVRGLHAAIEQKIGSNVTLHLHKEFMATECSGLDLSTLTPDRTAPTVPPVITSPKDTEPTAQEIFAWLINEYKRSKGNE